MLGGIAFGHANAIEWECEQVISTRFARPCHNVAGRGALHEVPIDRLTRLRRRGVLVLALLSRLFDQARHALIVRAWPVDFAAGRAAPEFVIEARGVFRHLVFHFVRCGRLQQTIATQAAREGFCHAAEDRSAGSLRAVCSRGAVARTQ